MTSFELSFGNLWCAPRFYRADGPFKDLLGLILAYIHCNTIDLLTWGNLRNLFLNTNQASLVGQAVTVPPVGLNAHLMCDVAPI